MSAPSRLLQSCSRAMANTPLLISGGCGRTRETITGDCQRYTSGRRLLPLLDGRERAGPVCLCEKSGLRACRPARSDTLGTSDLYLAVGVPTHRPVVTNPRYDVVVRRARPVRPWSGWGNASDLSGCSSRSGSWALNGDRGSVPVVEIGTGARE